MAVRAGLRQPVRKLDAREGRLARPALVEPRPSCTRRGTSHQARPGQARPCRAVPCSAVPCHTTPCHAVSCRAILYRMNIMIVKARCRHPARLRITANVACDRHGYEPSLARRVSAGWRPPATRARRPDASARSEELTLKGPFVGGVRMGRWTIALAVSWYPSEIYALKKEIYIRPCSPLILDAAYALSCMKNLSPNTGRVSGRWGGWPQRREEAARQASDWVVLVGCEGQEKGRSDVCVRSSK